MSSTSFCTHSSVMQLEIIGLLETMNFNGLLDDSGQKNQSYAHYINQFSQLPSSADTNKKCRGVESKLYLIKHIKL